MITQFATLTPQTPIDEAIETLFRTSQTEFPVVDVAGRLVGLLGRSDMIRALKQFGPDARVADVMVTDVPVLDRRGRLDEAFQLLQDKSARAVGITDPLGKLIGLITPETVGEMLMVREALPAGVRFGPWSRPA
jgi:stage IV sporulation protein FB